MLPPEKLGPGYEGETAERVGDLWYGYYDLSRWVLPPWVGQVGFLLLHGVLAVVVGWGRFEWRHWRR